MGGEEEMAVFSLPELILLEDFGGNPMVYLEEVYKIFKKDFVDSKPNFEGKRLGLKKYPLVEGKEYTFYHFTHDGDIETERIPNLRRMERIRWPRPLIENSKESILKVWRNKRHGNGGTKERIVIFHEKEKYLVVLDVRKDFILPWTAYLVQENKKKRLLKEYEEYKAETAK